MRRDPRWTFFGDASTLAEPSVDTAVLVGPQQVTDVHLVNLAATCGVVLATFDTALPTWLAQVDREHAVIIPS